jgi:hypothetical protein
VKKSARTGQTQSKRLREYDNGAIAGNLASQGGGRTGGAGRTIPATDYKTRDGIAEHLPDDLAWLTACRPAARADSGIRRGPPSGHPARADDSITNAATPSLGIKPPASGKGSEL